jgi:hypothetical protein
MADVLRFEGESQIGEPPSRRGRMIILFIAIESMTMLKVIVVKSDKGLHCLGIIDSGHRVKGTVVPPLSLLWMQSKRGILRLVRRSLSPGTSFRALKWMSKWPPLKRRSPVAVRCLTTKCPSVRM